MPEIVTRAVDEAARAALVAGGCDKRLAPLFAARGVREYGELASTFDALTSPEHLAHIDEAATLLADAIAKKERLLVVADYDADGATACAVAVRALRLLGATVDYIVPHRFRHGYGLTPEVVREAAERKPDLIITVDNGIAAVAGVEEATKLGIRVLVTDHHLPGDQRPAATCIVNPNQAGCGFPSKNLAGVGVIFYVMLALRAELRRRGAFAGTPPPNLANLLDIVALGTVADVVKLDANNRILVAQGLARIRAGKACPGIRALFEVAGRPTWRAATYDLGFVAGPRLNAAGRMDDMSLGIECLITDDPARARQLASQLDKLNKERREVEGTMQESALALIADIPETDSFTMSIHHPEWHAGVVGLLASRIKDRFHRPVFAFAADGEGTLRGSGRSIPGLHLRDALDLVDKRNAGLLARFGGHAAAAGVTLTAGSLERFRAAFEAVARELLSASDLERRIETDGELAADEATLELAKLLREVPWGQGFPDPRFVGRFRVIEQRTVGGNHAKLVLGNGARRYEAIRFGSAEVLPAEVFAVYRLDVNEYRGNETLQLMLEHCEAG